jgi:hypothetical protein
MEGRTSPNPNVTWEQEQAAYDRYQDYWYYEDYYYDDYEHDTEEARIPARPRTSCATTSVARNILASDLGLIAKAATMAP